MISRLSNPMGNSQSLSYLPYPTAFEIDVHSLPHGTHSLLGLCNTTVSWFSSYLTGCSFSISFISSSSSPRLLTIRNDPTFSPQTSLSLKSTLIPSGISYDSWLKFHLHTHNSQIYISHQTSFLNFRPRYSTTYLLPLDV